ncbi:MAG: electron transfer flavoprotein subunit beta/FixA family protein [Deltaproteobacteria bacterium]|nr:electron transfer flavoprotein subunit beta/FixA family protein [Deltaproteobacteria bacterium]
MDIIVCIKRIPDTAAKVEIDAGGLEIKKDVPWVMNPYDEFAVEEALRIKEKFGGKVTLLHAGAEGGEEVLKKGLAMGADEAVYIKDRSLAALDSMAFAKVLSAVIKTKPFDVILCGRMGMDTASGLLGGALAALLKIPCVPAIKKLTIFPQKTALAAREIEGGMETVQCPLPALFTAHKGLNEPRYPSLSGIMRSKKQEIKYITPASLGIMPDVADLKRTALSYPTSSRKSAILKGDASAQAKEAIKFLRDEVKII